MSRHLPGLLGRLLALACTSYFLIATSAPYEAPQDCQHVAEAVTYQVSGDCGDAGQIVVQSPANECAIFVQGASDVGLPSAGRFDYFEGSSQVSLANNPWTLSGTLPESATGASPTADAGTFWVATDAGPRSDAGLDGGAGAAADAGGTPVLTTPAQPQHASVVTRTCSHAIEYARLGVAGESLSCRDSSDTKSCVATLTRL